MASLKNHPSEGPEEAGTFIYCLETILGDIVIHQGREAEEECRHLRQDTIQMHKNCLQRLLLKSDGAKGYSVGWAGDMASCVFSEPRNESARILITNFLALRQATHAINVSGA